MGEPIVFAARHLFIVGEYMDAHNPRQAQMGHGDKTRVLKRVFQKVGGRGNQTVMVLEAVQSVRGLPAHRPFIPPSFGL